MVIPVLNEAETIAWLLTRIDRTLKQAGIRYEAIVIDDHSTDKTPQIVRAMEFLFPVALYTKRGKRGKAFSLMEGFSKAKYDTIVMIDGDLQYPPEAIPSMLGRLNTKTAVVVADRKTDQSPLFRRVLCRSFRFIFGWRLHRFECDVQSGLKVFKREILRRIHLKPTAWTFDLEFLVKAREAGYNIVSIPIVLSPRRAGASKMNLPIAGFNMALEAIRMKAAENAVIPLTTSKHRKERHGFHLNGRKFVPFTGLPIRESALFHLFGKQKELTIVLLVSVLIAFLINWHTTLTGLIAVMIAIYCSVIGFNLLLVLRSLKFKPEFTIQLNPVEENDAARLPTYSIICPLYKEWQVLPQFIAAIEKLDYPKTKLQVLLVLEKDDARTITKARSLSLPSYITMLLVPPWNPKTKPKACNFALSRATGEYAVIYDAEDIPEPDQLKKVVRAFRKAPDEIVCIQAKLDFYNPKQNVLTKIFSSEYSFWFDLTLPGLQSLNAPIPLGGTSNHFKTKVLKALNGWDAFNVTEDCDLGIRLAKHGYQTAIVDSVTHEEANSDMKNWFWQRTRWVKGYLQTFLVHCRDPQTFATKRSLRHFVEFILTVGGKVSAMYINPLMWIMTIVYFVFRPQAGGFIDSLFPTPIFYMGTISLIIGNFLNLYYYMIGCAKRGYFELIKYCFLIPVYWLFMSAAAWVALYKLFTEPHHWSKTTHGFHLKVQEDELRVRTGPVQFKPSFSTYH